MTPMPFTLTHTLTYSLPQIGSQPVVSIHPSPLQQQALYVGSLDPREISGDIVSDEQRSNVAETVMPGGYT